MLSQNQIERTLSQPAAIAYVAELLDAGEFIHCGELAEFLCEQFGFYADSTARVARLDTMAA